MINLKYDQDNQFKIIQFTDLHLASVPSNDKDTKTYENIKRLLDIQRPNLIVFSGDIIDSIEEHGANNPAVSFEKFINFLNELQIPVAITFGNHDSEGQVSRDDLRKICNEKLTCHAKKSEVNLVNGRENYILEIKDSEDNVRNLVFMVDSGDYENEEYSYYAWVDLEQISWFNQVNEKYGHTGTNKSDLIFQHIPLPEYWQASEDIIAGDFKESFAQNLEWLEQSQDLDNQSQTKLKNKSIPEYGVCSPELNSGFFIQMLKSNVWGMFVGHDHNNSFDSIYKGIHLVYGQSTGYNSYGNKKGARVINLDAKNNQISTDIILFDEF
ncbi:metallophosphoesterase [Anaerococcus sp. mt242]|uniref:metallophosphoesterase n=1 Tax=Anaerococcus sp. mt242 TaxID=2661917 RepID=UPI001932C6A9|nr:metallophosphoesterase [Anaerococcus sp. mt242]MBM0046145.1 metallophosphoesterase [Anaerococcus sp. mt242]